MFFTEYQPLPLKSWTFLEYKNNKTLRMTFKREPVLHLICKKLCRHEMLICISFGPEQQRIFVSSSKGFRIFDVLMPLREMKPHMGKKQYSHDCSSHLF